MNQKAGFPDLFSVVLKKVFMKHNKFCSYYSCSRWSGLGPGLSQLVGWLDPSMGSLVSCPLAAGFMRFPAVWALFVYRQEIGDCPAEFRSSFLFRWGFYRRLAVLVLPIPISMRWFKLWRLVILEPVWECHRRPALWGTFKLRSDLLCPLFVQYCVGSRSSLF